VATPESPKNVLESSMVNGGLTSHSRENGAGAAQQVPVQRKKLLKAPTLAELDSSDSERLHTKRVDFNVVHSVSLDPPKFLPISSTPQPERRQPPQRRHSIEKETPTNVRQFLPASRQSSRSLEEFCYPVECLALTVEEVMHIRQVLVKAELEKYQQYKDVYTALKKGKLCFCCRTRRFSFFTWSYTCQFCKRPVCSQCCKKYCSFSVLFGILDAAALQAILHPSYLFIGTFCLAERGKLYEARKTLHWPPSATSEHCQFISEIINSSRHSLVLANKRARLKRKTQSFYVSSAGPSEYCPSERTISEV
ncbi:hypothetical protein E2I00_007699, partial [Balaenoptera physalus]